MLVNDISEFYDSLADEYATLFGNWDKSIETQGRILTKFISELGHKPPKKILDCSCGTGMQSIGLAINGFDVLGVDISENSIRHAKRKAKQFKCSPNFILADTKMLSRKITQSFDIVIAFNFLPHQITDCEMHKTLKNVFQLTKQQGLFMASMKNYDFLLKNKPKIAQPQFVVNSNHKLIFFEVWKWKNDNIYELHHFILKKQKHQWETTCNIATFRAYRQSELSEFLSEVGFTNILWHSFEKTGYYQPIVTAIKK